MAAYYEFQLDFVNLGPFQNAAYFEPWTTAIACDAETSGSAKFSGSADIPEPSSSSQASLVLQTPEEIEPDALVWFKISIMNINFYPTPSDVFEVYLIGPYTVGDIGTETSVGGGGGV